MLGLLLAGCLARVSTPPLPARDPTSAYAALLGRIVTRDGLVRWKELRDDPEPLAEYVGWIAVHGPEVDGYRLLDDNRRLAYHINAYNALTMWGVLQAGQIRSVSDVPGFFWRQEFGVDGEWMSLFTYETRVILPTYEEPLAHAALNCASYSCPPLWNQLYTGPGLQTQLENNMRRWIAVDDPKRAAVTFDGEQFVFSQIFEWYGGDFEAWAGAETPCDAVRPYAEGPLLDALTAHPACLHRFYTYDWSLNAGR